MKACRALCLLRSGANVCRYYRRASGSKDRNGPRSFQTSRERGPHVPSRHFRSQAQLVNPNLIQVWLQDACKQFVITWDCYYSPVLLAVFAMEPELQSRRVLQIDIGPAMLP